MIVDLGNYVIGNRSDLGNYKIADRPPGSAINRLPATAGSAWTATDWVKNGDRWTITHIGQQGGLTEQWSDPKPWRSLTNSTRRPRTQHRTGQSLPSALGEPCTRCRVLGSCGEAVVLCEDL